MGGKFKQFRKLQVKCHGVREYYRNKLQIRTESSYAHGLQAQPVEPVQQEIKEDQEFHNPHFFSEQGHSSGQLGMF